MCVYHETAGDNLHCDYEWKQSVAWTPYDTCITNKTHIYYISVT